MKIYRATITAHPDNGSAPTVILDEHGANLTQLQYRRQAAEAKIEPDDEAWTSHLDGWGCSVRIDRMQYESRLVPIDLVC
jgi:hypothetical protein